MCGSVYEYANIPRGSSGWAGRALALPKRAAGTAPLVMADCSSPWLTEWLTDRSYSAYMKGGTGERE